MIDKYHVSLVTKYVRRLTEMSKIFQTKQKFKKKVSRFKIFVFESSKIFRKILEKKLLKPQRDENKVWIYLSALFQASLKLQKDLWSPQNLLFTSFWWVYPYDGSNPSQSDCGTLKSENYRDIITVQW